MWSKKRENGCEKRGMGKTEKKSEINKEGKGKKRDKEHTTTKLAFVFDFPKIRT